jgi:hypothetical protein
MGLFSKILSKLGLKKPEEEAAPPTISQKEVKPVATPTKQPEPTRQPVQTSQPVQPKAPVQSRQPVQSREPVRVAAQPAPKAEPAVTPVPAAKPDAMEMVDVMSKLETMAKGTNLDWKVSIVDLLKVLGLESSLEDRKELAVELGCPPEVMQDNVKMNVWLHKTVLAKIAENGGNIPQELLD